VAAVGNACDENEVFHQVHDSLAPCGAGLRQSSAPDGEDARARNSLIKLGRLVIRSGKTCARRGVQAVSSIAQNAAPAWLPDPDGV
jgi:hypothetical protein